VPGSVKSFGVLLVELSRKFDAPASSLTFSHSLAGFFHLSLGKCFPIFFQAVFSFNLNINNIIYFTEFN